MHGVCTNSTDCVDKSNLRYVSENELSKCSTPCQCSVDRDERTLDDEQQNLVVDEFATILNLSPSSTSKYKCVRSLNLRNTQLKEVPDEIRHLINLVSVDLSFNQLETLPRALSSAVNLRHLDLSHNKFTQVPSILTETFQFLRLLNLSFNEITCFDEQPHCITNLVELNVSHNKLISLPKWILYSHCQIENLGISNNSLHKIYKIHPSFSAHVSFVNLRVLIMEDCKLCPKDLQIFAASSNLEVIKLSNTMEGIYTNNRFPRIDDQCFKNCKNLKEMHAKRCEISILSLNYDNFKHLHYLNLERNNLTWLSDSFCNMCSLKICKLGHNSLLFLPTDIGKLINIEELYLEFNELGELPDSFKLLVNLKYCDLYSNNITHIDPQILCMKSLIGIDLECNQINFSALHEDQQEYNEFILKYSTLKENYRKNVKDTRYDKQSLIMEESSDGLDVTSSSDEESELPEIVTPSVEVKVGKLEEEDWDKEADSLVNNEDEQFDPNVNYKNCVGQLRIYERNGPLGRFCPGDSHLPSVANFFKRRPQDVPVDGQFELN